MSQQRSHSDSNRKRIRERLVSYLTPSRRPLLFILFAALSLAAAGGFINTRIIYPAFTNIIIEGISDDAKRIASHLLPPALKHTSLVSERLTPRFFGDIYKLENDFGLIKVKIISFKGTVIYSTDPDDIGSQSCAHFAQRSGKKAVFTQLLKLNQRSMDGDTFLAEVVETYIPITSGDRFLGAFELYFDITKRMQHLHRLVTYSTIAMGALASALIITVLILIRKETSRQKAQEKAEALKEEVDRITRHDLKSPVAGILSGLTYLESFTELTDEQTAIAADMRKAANTALNLMTRSLDLFKMETGTYTFEPVPVDIPVTCQRAITDLGELARTRGVILTLNEPTEPTTALADETLCYLTIANLLKNAIEASTVGDTVMIDFASKDRITVAISNPAEVSADIKSTFFDKYSTSGKQSGTGIGTYSARLMARTMNGDLTMTSSKANGTTVTLTLPKE